MSLPSLPATAAPGALRARGQLAELRTADLRFTPEEASALLAATAGPGLPDAAAQALEARTEG
jgi:LuxR family maltose regulon positive regulatory protein